MRAIWKGAVSFGLVSVPVKLYAATESHDVSFRQVHAKDGGRIRYQRVCSLDGEEVPVNVGLHWGPNLYIGQIVTGGRLEVTAIGDEVNECARLQQGAAGGQVLASKVLLERLDDADAAALGIDRANLTYRPLAEEGRKAADDEKALRDAGRLPVVDLSRGR